MIQLLKKYIRQFFGFSANQTNGMLILLVITTIAVIIPPLFAYYQDTQEPDNQQDLPTKQKRKNHTGEQS